MSAEGQLFISKLLSPFFNGPILYVLEDPTAILSDLQGCSATVQNRGSEIMSQ